jgi:hypothetical protein
VARYLVGSLVVLGLAACGKSWLAERDAWRHEAEVACLKTGQVKEGPALARIQPISGPGICGADFPLKVAAIGDGPAIGYADELRPPGNIPGVRQPLASPAYAPRPPSQAYPAEPQTYPAEQYPRQPPQTYPQQSYPQQYPRQHYPAQPYPSVAAPMRLAPPGVAPPEPEGEEDDIEQPGQNAQSYPQRTPAYGAPPPYRPTVRAEPYQPYPPQSYPSRTYPAQPQQALPSRPAYPEAVPLGSERGPVTTGAVAVQPAATLACPIVSRLDSWFAEGVQPAAMRWFGVQVAEIRQISAYSCRGMNGQRGAPISEHAFGNALDIASFTLADGRKVTVKDGWRGSPEEQGFLRDVHAAACQRFTTVLAPGSNAFHYDHIHVDLSRRASGRAVCNPAAVPGDQIAALAGYRFGARGEPGVTGSIRKPVRKPTFFKMRGRDEVYDGLPRAVPGED